jgi:class 3 adenylate cyclase
LASRMESHGRRRCIQVTGSTYELIRDVFDCAALGLIEVKGVGAMEVWHVIGRKRNDVLYPSVGPANHAASGQVD